MEIYARIGGFLDDETAGMKHGPPTENRSHKAEEELNRSSRKSVLTN